MRHDEPTDEEINDFIDGRLDDSRRDEVQRWLARYPERQRDIERQRELNDALRDLGTDILDEPIPERLRKILQQQSIEDDPSPPEAGGRSRHLLRSLGVGNLLSGLALVLLGTATGWTARSAFAPETSAFDTLLADASYAYSFYARDRDYRIEFPPDGIDTYTAASKQVFERAVDPPDLAEAGYAFRGARITPIGQRTSTFFFFEDEEGRNVTVIFWQQGDDTGVAPGFRSLGEVLATFWFSGGFGFAVLGQDDEPSVRQVSDQVVRFYGHELADTFSSR